MLVRAIVLVLSFLSGCAHIHCENLDEFSDDPNVQAINLIASVGCAIRDSNSEPQSDALNAEEQKECVTWRVGEKMSCEEGVAFDKARSEESKLQ
mgnify:FL=1